MLLNWKYTSIHLYLFKMYVFKVFLYNFRHLFYFSAKQHTSKHESTVIYPWQLAFKMYFEAIELMLTAWSLRITFSSIFTRCNSKKHIRLKRKTIFAVTERGKCLLLISLTKRHLFPNAIFVSGKTHIYQSLNQCKYKKSAGIPFNLIYWHSQ